MFFQRNSEPFDPYNLGITSVKFVNNTFYSNLFYTDDRIFLSLNDILFERNIFQEFEHDILPLNPNPVSIYDPRSSYLMSGITFKQNTFKFNYDGLSIISISEFHP